jgi:hypothetical protein
MTTEREPGLAASRQWLDWLSVHTWWAALLVGGVLCVLALALS